MQQIKSQHVLIQNRATLAHVVQVVSEMKSENMFLNCAGRCEIEFITRKGLRVTFEFNVENENFHISYFNLAS